jgi:hypothetical protein
MHGLPLMQFVAVAMLILANAFFVAAEFALVSIRDTRIEQMLAAGVPGARAVRRLQQDLDDFLPAVQLGVTLCSLALGWLGEPLAASVLMGWLGALPLGQAYLASTPTLSPSRSALPLSLTSMWWWANWCPSRWPCAGQRRWPSPLPAHAGLHGLARPAVRFLKDRPPSSCAASIFP